MENEPISFEEYLQNLDLGGGVTGGVFGELTQEQLDEIFAQTDSYAQLVADDAVNINVEQESDKRLMFAGVGLLAGLILSKFIKL